MSLFRLIRTQMIKSKALYSELAFILSIGNTLMLIQLTFSFPPIFFISIIIISGSALVYLSGFWWKHQVALDIKERVEINPMYLLQKKTTKDIELIKKHLGLVD